MRHSLAPVTFAALLVVSQPSAQTQLQEITVPGTSYLGWRLSAAGDLDGDGFPDVATTDLTGHGYAFSGATGAHLYTIPSHHDDISGIGDVNADGRDDLGAVSTSANSVVLVSGLDGSSLATLGLSGASSIAPVGDLDLDGFDDFAVGFEAAGRIDIIDGQSLSVVRSLVGSSGAKLRNAGDVDADGFDDLITLAGGPEPKVRVWSPVNGLLLHQFSASHGLPSAAIDGAGDVDADGHADLIIGDYLRDRVRVYSGADGSVLHQFPGFGLIYFGYAVTSAGDVNLDGHDDVAIRMGSDGISVRSGLDGTELYFYQRYAYFGWQLAFLGDTDGDGFPEIASSSEQGGSEPGNGPGFVEIVSPCALPSQVYCELSPNSVGPGARIRFAGSSSQAAGIASIGVAGAVPGQSGLFFYGPSRSSSPFGDGVLCVAAGAYGLFRLGPPAAVAPDGTASRALTLVAGPGLPALGELAAGSSWHFQFWYRDPGGPGGSGFNLSDACTLVVCP